MKGTVLILGARSDMSIALARQFAEKGWSLQLAARTPETLQSLMKDLQIRYKASVTTHPFDSLDFSSHAAFYQSLPVKPDIVIYVAGIMPEQSVAFENEVLCRQMIDTNYTGAVSILNIIARDFCQRKKGTIVGISSVAGLRGRQSNFLYGSTKAALTTYLSGLRNYCYHHQVQVLTVLPGFVYTKMTTHLQLPKLLTATPAQLARDVYRGVERKKNIIYVKWFWRYIMLVIRSIPELIFKTLKL